MAKGKTVLPFKRDVNAPVLKEYVHLTLSFFFAFSIGQLVRHGAWAHKQGHSQCWV